MGNLKNSIIQLASCFILNANQRRLFRGKFIQKENDLDNYIENVAAYRNKILSKYVNLTQKAGLEIGPLHAPQIDNSIYNIKYADLQNRENIIKYYDGDPNILFDKIPEIDYIVSPTDPSESINEKFDYIIANHVIEHCPNPILYIQSLSKILNEDGILFMSIPDGKFTFDKNRPMTTFDHLIDDYLRNTDNKDSSHLFEQNRLVTHPSITLKEVYNKTVEALKLKQNFSHLHYHVFSVDSFKEIFEQVIEIELFDLNILYLGRPHKELTEFYLIAQKTKTKA